MKKTVAVALVCGVVSGSVVAAPSYIRRVYDGGYNVTYDYKDKAKSGWYAGARAELSFLNWENKYKSAIFEDGSADHDKYFEPVFGGSAVFGRTFNYFWRAEIEGGIIGAFSDKDDGFEFKMTVPYLMLNGYYDFTNGLYVGAGLGIAVPRTELDGFFKSGDRAEWHVSPMGGLMFGWAHHLDDSVVLDIRYRLAGFGGMKQTRTLNTGYEFENKINFVLDNSISLGIRYEF